MWQPFLGLMCLVSLRFTGKGTLTIANSLWGCQSISFKPDFLLRNIQFFGAEILTLDFMDPNTLKTINQWIDLSTNNKIPHILDEINSNAVLFMGVVMES